MIPDITYSVVTPCLNSAATLDRSIDSVLWQRIPPKEYIFVDGGSTDGTLEIIMRKRQEHARSGGSIEFRLLDHGRPRGVPAAFNDGIAQCTSEAVFILNSDDWYERHCSEIVLAAMKDHPRTDIVVGRAHTYRPGESVPCGVLRNRPEWLLPALMPFVHPACFVRRTVYDRIGYFNPAYKWNSDYDFLYRCKVAGITFLKVPEVLVNFQWEGGADQHRDEARLDAYRISRRYSRTPILPLFGLAARFLTGR
jgi:glycosyltransferase involved in cell wall biosynthesis